MYSLHVLDTVHKGAVKAMSLRRPVCKGTTLFILQTLIPVQQNIMRGMLVMKRHYFLEKTQVIHRYVFYKEMVFTWMHFQP